MLIMSASFGWINTSEWWWLFGMHFNMLELSFSRSLYVYLLIASLFVIET